MTTRNIPESYATVAAAVAAASSGDIISINDDSEPYSISDISLAGKALTLKAGVGVSPIIDWTLTAAYGFTGDSALVVEGLIFIGRDEGVAHVLFALAAATPLTLSRCVFKGGAGLCPIDVIPNTTRCWFEAQYGEPSGEPGVTESRFVFGAVESCVFRSQRTAWSRLLNATTVQNSTFIDCWSVVTLVVASASGESNVFVGCDAEVMIEGHPCNGNVAGLCWASVQLFAGPPIADNHNRDPGLTEIPKNKLYPVNGSFITWLGAGATAALDYDGAAVDGTPGAFSALRVQATMVDATTLLLKFKGDVANTNAAWNAPWSQIAFLSSARAPLALVRAHTAVVEADASDPVGVAGFALRLTVWPELSPSASYRVEFASVPMLSGPARSGVYVDFETDDTITIATRDEPPPYDSPEDYLRATGSMIAELVSTPKTVLHRSYAPGDDVMWVQSTYRFAAAGMVTLGKIDFTYTAKADGCLLGVSSPDTPLKTYLAGEEVFSNERSAQLAS